MNNQKGVASLIIFLIILGVVVVAGGGAWVWQNYYSVKTECKVDIDCPQLIANGAGPNFPINKCVDGKCVLQQLACTPNWQCGWGECKNGYQGQTAIDSNNCGLPSSTAQIACIALARECTVQPLCQTDNDCREVSCPAMGGFAHEHCVQGKCVFAAGVAERCAGASEGSFCGGIAGIRCASGLTCKLDGTYPDAGGKCIK